MQIVSDLHLHSKYSRAVSPQMVLPVMTQMAKQKGIDLITTGDFTHPLWLKEISNQLEEAQEGIYRMKGEDNGIHFLLSVEISCIYSQGGKGRRIHNLVFVPSFAVAQKVTKELMSHGSNLSSDGRPIISLSSKQLLELILSVDERSLLIPAHVWTPWFGIYGQMSGFNSLQESFGELTPFVYGIETGLSSDPEMNWQMQELKTRSILSFSDAHSPAKMGREATVFELEGLSYENIRQAIIAPSKKMSGANKVAYTIEFYPEEGKYHYSGHRNCHVTMTPAQQKEVNGICPVCGKHVTDGVMRRVQELGTKEDKVEVIEKEGNKWFTDTTTIHPPFVKIVPLNEIIAQAIQRPVTSPKVKVIFDDLCLKLKSEFFVLLYASIEDIAKIAGQHIAQSIQKVRGGNILIAPGYDGIYGTVTIWDKDNQDKTVDQLGLL